jgi:hypothetical protein
MAERMETIIEGKQQLAGKKCSEATSSDIVKYEYINESKCSIETMLSEYKMGKVLGQGTSGKVQLATHVYPLIPAARCIRRGCDMLPGPASGLPARARE